MTDISLNSLKHWTEILSVFRSKTLFLLSANRQHTQSNSFFQIHNTVTAPATQNTKLVR